MHFKLVIHEPAAAYSLISDHVGVDGHNHDLRLHFHCSLSLSGCTHTKKTHTELSADMSLFPLSSALIHVAQPSWF